uniref:Uncharacterized protein n=1 Tax=Xiphophorus couchianus TaxID=32473 RepID=A0A3B5LQC2_9TELE
MSKINSGSTGCRAVVMAGKYLSGPGRCSAVLAGTSGRQRGQMCADQRRTGSSTAARMGGRTAAAGQQESPGYFSAADRHALANRNLIYRDVKAFLSEVGGDPREARYWLAQFQRANLSQSPAFAVLEVDDLVFQSRETVQSLAFGLSFLQRMDMKLVVVMGCSYNQESGSWCTRGLVERCQQLTEALQLHSATVLPFFSAESFLQLHEAPQGSSAPHSISVDISLLQWSLDCGTIPLVCPVGRDGRGCSLVLDPTEVTAAISRALQPLKVMFLNNSGGLRGEKHKVLDTVSLPTDLPGLSAAEWLGQVERRRLTTIARLLNQLPTESSAVITSADTLLTELFSHRGEASDVLSSLFVNMFVFTGCKTHQL